MLVSRVSSVNNSNVVSARVGSRRIAFTQGTLPVDAASVVKRVLPHCQQQDYGDKIIRATLESPDPAAVTDAIKAEMADAAEKLSLLLSERGPMPPPLDPCMFDSGLVKLM